MASKLSQMQARFQQKQMQEKEEKLLKLYENQQQRAFERVGRGSAGSNNSLNLSTGKVRQLFEERRQKAGIDRSYPLEPLKSSKPTARGNSLDRRNPTVRNVKTTVQKSMSTVRNGKPIINNRQITETVYNNNGGEESYAEKHYVDDEADNYLKQHQDIVDMMNNHNLNDSLENEEMPHFGFDDEPTVFNGKLANVGGKLPSQATPIKKPPTKTIPAIRTTPPKKETKPAIKTTVVKTIKRTPSSAGSTGSQTASPVKTAAMSKVRPVSNKSPSAVRPSSKNATRPPNTAVQRDDLVGCRFCQRRFASDRLQVHEDICSKTAKKKRKVYDATKHRIEGTEVEPYTKKVMKAKGKTAPLKNNWRQKHEEFISTIRAAKQAQAYVAKGGNLKDLPPPPPSSNPDYVQCPHCGRRFNSSAAERHIPKCASYAFNKPKNSIKLTPKR